jgi:hypothetical protein
MKARFTPTEPGQIEFSMTITMTVQEWSLLKQQLDTGNDLRCSPTCSLVYHIRDLVTQAEKFFLPQASEPNRKSCGCPDDSAVDCAKLTSSNFSFCRCPCHVVEK